jgi:phage terminase small subunit
MFGDNSYQRLLDALEPQQRRFVEEYAKDLNAAAAAIRAGYSERTARQQASRLLKRQAIKDAIEAGQVLHADNAKTTAAGMRGILVSMAFGSITDFLDERGNLLPRHRWSSGAEHAVQSISVRPSDHGAIVVKLKLCNRTRALAKVKALVEAIDDKLVSREKRFGRMRMVDLERMILSGLRHAFANRDLRVIDREGCTVDLATIDVRDDAPTKSKAARRASLNARYQKILGWLSPQHRRFVEEYLEDFSAPSAAIRAGYSASSARNQASRLMKNPVVVNAIDAGQHLLDDWATPTGIRLREKLAPIAFANITNFVDETGKFLPPDRWPPGAEHAVEAITIRYGKNGCTVETLKLANKNSALSMLLDLLKVVEAKQTRTDEIMAKTSDEAILAHLGTQLPGILRNFGYRLIDGRGRLINPETFEAEDDPTH